MKREKRLEKGIKSMNEQIEMHKDKKAMALEQRKFELAGYYEKEIDSMKIIRRKKEEKLHRKNKDYRKDEDNIGEK